MRITEYKSKIPEGCSGDWKVEKFSISEEEAKFDMMRRSISGFGDWRRAVRPGSFTMLKYKGAIVMSDTRAELMDLIDLISAAEGSVLVNGLGLGMAVQMLLDKPEVTDITVIEISPDVITLVGPFFARDKRVTIIQADALKWKAPKGIRYNVVWHDIWNDICTDNLSEMKKLHRRYGGKTDWQGSWCRELLR